jgi:hypothetical protein
MTQGSIEWPERRNAKVLCSLYTHGIIRIPKIHIIRGIEITVTKSLGTQGTGVLGGGLVCKPPPDARPGLPIEVQRGSADGPARTIRFMVLTNRDYITLYTQIALCLRNITICCITVCIMRSDFLWKISGQARFTTLDYLS